MIKLNQKGFAAFEVVLIVITLVAIGAAGYFAYQARQGAAEEAASTPEKTTQPTQTSNLQSYKDVEGIYTLEYPQGWTIKNSNVQPSAAFAKVVGTDLTLFAPEDEEFGVIVRKYQTSDPVGDYKNFDSTPISATKSTINGNPAHYFQIVSDFSTDDTYFIVHNDITLSLVFREKQNGAVHNNLVSSFDHTKYVSDYQAIAKSVKFLK